MKRLSCLNSGQTHAEITVTVIEKCEEKVAEANVSAGDRLPHNSKDDYQWACQ